MGDRRETSSGPSGLRKCGGGHSDHRFPRAHSRHQPGFRDDHRLQLTRSNRPKPEHHAVGTARCRILSKHMAPDRRFGEMGRGALGSAKIGRSLSEKIIGQRHHQPFRRGGQLRRGLLRHQRPKTDRSRSRTVGLLRPPYPASQPDSLHRPADPCADPLLADQDAGGPSLHRPRPVQKRQRHHGPFGGGRTPRRGGREDQILHPGDRHPFPLGRGRVHPDFRKRHQPSAGRSGGVEHRGGDRAALSPCGDGRSTSAPASGSPSTPTTQAKGGTRRPSSKTPTPPCIRPKPKDGGPIRSSPAR